MAPNLAILSVILVLFYMRTFGTASILFSESNYPKTCKDLRESQLKNDVLQIQIDVNKEPFYVKCNHELDGGGWTVVLNRYDGSRDFDCRWNDCVQGFGNVNGEFFIGLEKLHDITLSTLHELMFVMEDFSGDSRTARYDSFAVDDASNFFMIKVLGNYTGNAGDSFEYHAGYKFSTKDKDSSNTCTKQRDSPGWFNSCTRSNIFGKYANGQYANKGNVQFWGMHWYTFRGTLYSLKKLAMFIRPVTI